MAGTGNDQVDQWIGKLQAIGDVVGEGVKEKYEEHGPGLGQFWDKTKGVTNSVVKGVSDGTKADVDGKAKTTAAVARVRDPPRGLYTMAAVAGLATAFGVSSYLVIQEVKLRTLLRAMSKDWREDVGDGLVGPVGHMHRPFFAQIDHHLQSATTPRGKTWAHKARNWWVAGTQVTASPTATKQMYHGMMAMCHSLSFVVRFRYHLAHGRPSSFEPTATGAAVSQPDAVEQFAFDVAVLLKKVVKGKILEEKKEIPTTASGEVVPPVGTIAVGGSLMLAVWHWVQFARCYAQRGGALYAPLRQGVVAPTLAFLKRKLPAKFFTVVTMVNANLETLALLGESCAAVTGGLQLLAPLSTRHVAATAALRFATFGKLVATSHRLFDDTEHTLHCYGSTDRQMIFVAATGLAVSAVLTPSACDYRGFSRIFSIISRGVGISCFFRARGVFSQPHGVRPQGPRHNTVYDTFTATVLSYALCFTISLMGAHHRKAQVSGLLALGGMLFGINQLVKKHELEAASAPSVAAPPTAGGGEAAQESARSNPTQDPPSYGTATKYSPRDEAGAEVAGEKESAPLPDSVSSDGFEHINHEETAQDHDMYGGRVQS